jgi:hypothetical protein
MSIDIRDALDEWVRLYPDAGDSEREGREDDLQGQMMYLLNDDS